MILVLSNNMSTHTISYNLYYQLCRLTELEMTSLPVSTRQLIVKMQTEIQQKRLREEEQKDEEYRAYKEREKWGWEPPSTCTCTDWGPQCKYCCYYSSMSHHKLMQQIKDKEQQEKTKLLDNEPENKKQKLV